MPRKDELAFAFNEWMRRYTENPEQFAREFQTVHEFLTQQKQGEPPSYGEVCAEYLLELLGRKVAGQ